jgi:hypothetical protein
MRTVLLCLLLAACASSKKQAVAPAATAGAGSMPSAAPAPEKKTAVEAGPVTQRPEAPPAASATAPPPAASGVMTAAEAAAAAASQRHGAAGDAPAATAEPDDSPCATDADCTFTRLAPGACCPMLCVPRPVTRKGSDALDAHVTSCALKQECPQPACRPPRTMTVPTCVQNKCVAKERPEKGMQ